MGQECWGRAEPMRETARALLTSLTMAFSGGASLEIAQPAMADDRPLPPFEAPHAEPALPPDPEAWRFNVALYAWAINIAGNVTARNQTIDTNASFIDLIQKSDSLAGFMGYFEADKGRVGFYSDLVFAKLGFGSGQTNYR